MDIFHLEFYLQLDFWPRSHLSTKQFLRFVLLFIYIVLHNICATLSSVRIREYNTTCGLYSSCSRLDVCCDIQHTLAAVIWPKYCRYGVKHYIINQSISTLSYSALSEKGLWWVSCLFGNSHTCIFQSDRGTSVFYLRVVHLVLGKEAVLIADVGVA